MINYMYIDVNKFNNSMHKINVEYIETATQLDNKIAVLNKVRQFV